MHKKVLLVCLTFLLVGCTRVDGVDDYISLVNDCLVDRAVTNDVSLGYKFYVPRGVRKIRDYDYNQVFLVNYYLEFVAQLKQVILHNLLYGCQLFHIFAY